MPAHGPTILADFRVKESDRQNFETHWEKMAKFGSPTRTFLSRRLPGTQVLRRMYDDTAPLAISRLANALHGLMINPQTRWFALRTMDEPLNENDNVRAWLDDVVSRMLRLFASPEFGFNTQSHEALLDIVTFGTAGMILNEEPRKIRFQTRSLTELYLGENESGQVDRVYRKFPLTPREAVQKFGAKAPRHAKENLNIPSKADGVFDTDDYLHAVFPREDADVTKIDGAN
ncbi:MAG: hypothetical protein IH987_05180, partial [Planctomycetes bacterium]|nr:hypothetical protein [Planctomycetota bacterium]